MLCKDIMRRPVRCAKQGETVASVAQTMRDANIGFVAVCDDTGRAVGVITDRDIAIRVCAQGLSAADTTAGQVMSSDVVSCHEHEGLAAAELMMARRRKSRVLIVDKEGAPAGVISLSDVALRSSSEGGAVLRQVVTREVLSEGGNRNRTKKLH